VVRGAEEPLSKLQAHIQSTPHRVLILAESSGRRESLLDFLRAGGVNPPAFDDLQEFQASDEKIGIATAALNSGFHWFEAGIDLVTETELFAAGVSTRRRKKQEQLHHACLRHIKMRWQMVVLKVVSFVSISKLLKQQNLDVGDAAQQNPFQNVSLLSLQN
jgi:transcription-repair coupling factor (superfamily II helicase)